MDEFDNLIAELADNAGVPVDGVQTPDATDTLPATAATPVNDDVAVEESPEEKDAAFDMLEEVMEVPKKRGRPTNAERAAKQEALAAAELAKGDEVEEETDEAKVDEVKEGEVPELTDEEKAAAQAEEEQAPDPVSLEIEKAFDGRYKSIEDIAKADKEHKQKITQLSQQLALVRQEAKEAALAASKTPEFKIGDHTPVQLMGIYEAAKTQGDMVAASNAAILLKEVNPAPYNELFNMAADPDQGGSPAGAEQFRMYADQMIQNRKDEQKAAMENAESKAKADFEKEARDALELVRKEIPDWAEHEQSIVDDLDKIDQVVPLPKTRHGLQIMMHLVYGANKYEALMAENAALKEQVKTNDVQSQVQNEAKQILEEEGERQLKSPAGSSLTGSPEGTQHRKVTPDNGHGFLEALIREDGKRI